VIDVAGGSDDDALGVGSHGREERFDVTREVNGGQTARGFARL
jgi:hypothetical protein